MRDTSVPLSAKFHPIALLVKPILSVLSAAVDTADGGKDNAASDKAALDAITAGLSATESQQFFGILEACRFSARMRNVRSALDLDQQDTDHE